MTNEGKTEESSDLTQPHQYDEPQPQQFTVPLMPAQPEQLCPQCGQSKDSPGEDSIERLLVCGASFHTQPAQVDPPTKGTIRNTNLWNRVDQAAKRVRTWPLWKKGSPINSRVEKSCGEQMASEWSEAELKRAVIAVSELQGPASTSRYEVALALARQRNRLRDALEHLLTLNNLRDRTDPDCCARIEAGPGVEMPKITLLDLTDADAEEAERLCNEDDETQPNWAGPWEQLAYYRRHCLSYRQQVAALKEKLKEMAKLGEEKRA